jgi:hypothetical protein
MSVSMETPQETAGSFGESENQSRDCAALLAQERPRRQRNRNSWGE